MYEQNVLDANSPQLQFIAEANEITSRLIHLRQSVGHNTVNANYYENELQQVMWYCNESTRLIQEMNSYQETPENNEQRTALLEDYQRRMYPLSDNANQLRINMYTQIRSVIDSLDEVQNKVIHRRLGKWHRDQALNGNGSPLPLNTLDEIQVWLGELAELICTTRALIVTMQKSQNPLTPQPNFNELFDVAYREITNLLQNLIVSSFIVEKQPPQVMKTNTKFAASVRLLLTNIDIHLNSPYVSVTILSEAQAQAQQQNHSLPLTEVSGEIKNNTGRLELQQATRHLTCDLHDMQLKNVNRAERTGTQTVMDEKFALLFQSIFLTGDVQLSVWVMSLPVVVIVHSSQEPQSWATITWDNAFSEVNRITFRVVDRVPWSSMASTLNMKFTFHTGRALTDENLHCLCEKAFRANINSNQEERQITWIQFGKDHLPGRTFTFWDWLYAAMKLTRDQLHGPWKDGSIIGFISKRQAEETLRTCSRGTFLLRFSDSELGGITIGWVERIVDNVPQIKMLQPFCYKDLVIRSLGDRIRDLTQLVTLYPDIPKDEAFRSYYTQCSGAAVNGYVQPVLRITVPDAN